MDLFIQVLHEGLSFSVGFSHITRQDSVEVRQNVLFHCNWVREDLCS